MNHVRINRVILRYFPRIFLRFDRSIKAIVLSYFFISKLLYAKIRIIVEAKSIEKRTIRSNLSRLNPELDPSFLDPSSESSFQKRIIESILFLSTVHFVLTDNRTEKTSANDPYNESTITLQIQRKNRRLSPDVFEGPVTFPLSIYPPNQARNANS